jgi:hypothetical protein
MGPKNPATGPGERMGQIPPPPGQAGAWGPIPSPRTVGAVRPGPNAERPGLLGPGRPSCRWSYCGCWVSSNVWYSSVV